MTPEERAENAWISGLCAARRAIARHQAERELRTRYTEQCELFPRTREIPLALYLRRNLAAATRNILVREYREGARA